MPHPGTFFWVVQWEQYPIPIKYILMRNFLTVSCVKVNFFPLHLNSLPNQTSLSFWSRECPKIDRVELILECRTLAINHCLHRSPFRIPLGIWIAETNDSAQTRAAITAAPLKQRQYVFVIKKQCTNGVGCDKCIPLCIRCSPIDTGKAVALSLYPSMIWPIRGDTTFQDPLLIPWLFLFPPLAAGRELPEKAGRSCGIRLAARPTGQQVRAAGIRLQHNVYRRDGTRQVHVDGHALQHQLWVTAFATFLAQCESQVQHVRVAGEQRQTEGKYSVNQRRSI